MNSKSRSVRNKGITLLEVIVVIIVASLFSSILFQFMFDSLDRSSETVNMVQDSFSLSGIMEKITADYNQLLFDKSNSPLETLETYLENGNDPEKTPYYGEYSWFFKYILFDVSGNEETDPCISDCNILKVTVTNANQTLTALFTK